MTQDQHDLIEEYYHLCFSNRRFGFQLCNQIPIDCTRCPFLSADVVVRCVSLFGDALDEYTKQHPEMTL